MNGTNVTRTVTPVLTDGYYDTLTVDVSLSTLEAEEQNLVLFGELEEESVDCVVLSIEPMDNLSAKLTLVDYSPAVYDSDTEIIPPFDSNITLPPVLMQRNIKQIPSVDATKIISDERAMERLSRNVYQYNIQVPFTNPTGTDTLPEKVKYVECQYDYNEDASTVWSRAEIVQVQSCNVLVPNVEEGASYKLRLRYVDTDGVTGQWTDTILHTVLGRSTAPSAVAGVTWEAFSNKLVVSWLANPEIDVEYYEIRSDENFGSDDSALLFYGQATSATVNAVIGASNYTYYIRAKDSAGNYSASSTEIVVGIGAPSQVPDATQTVTKVELGKATVVLNWPSATKGSFEIAGYEVRSSDSGWGTAGFLYKGDSTQVTFSDVSTVTPTTWYIKAFDVEGRYSALARVETHDVEVPPDLTAVTLIRTGIYFNMTCSYSGSLPSDFSHFEFRVGKVPVGAEAGISSTGDFWDDPDVIAVKSTTPNATLNLKTSNFAYPKIIDDELGGVTYRVAARMLDKSGNSSTNSVLASRAVTTI